MSSKKRKEISSSATGPAAKRTKQQQQADQAPAASAGPVVAGAAPSARRTNASHAPTVHDIINDPLTLLSLQYWAPGAQEKKPFDPRVVEDIFTNELSPESLNLSRVMLLELSFYLEKYPFTHPGDQARVAICLLRLDRFDPFFFHSFLWPNFDPAASTKAHLLSILLMVNEKFRENVSAFDCFHTAPDGIFTAFWQRVLSLYGELTSLREKSIYIQFMINCFQTLSDPLIRTHCMRLVSLPLWYCLTGGRLQLELERAPKLQRLWKALQKKNQAQMKDDSTMDFEREYLPSLIRDFFKVLSSIPTTGQVDAASVAFCERFIEFMTDLMNQLPTRRFFRAVLEDSHLVVRSRLSSLHKRPEGALFRQLLQILRFYENFEINDYTGQALTDEEMVKTHYDQMQRFQAVVFKKFPELKKMALANIGSIDSRQAITTHLAAMRDNSRLKQLCVELGLARDNASTGYAWIDAENDQELSREFMLEVIISQFERRISQIEALNERPLYPDETLLWDETVVPSQSSYTGQESIALPKLNLQFLTFHDHLLRNYTLFRLESTYEIRQDVEDVVRRLQPRRNQAGATSFRGWSRMALPLASGSSIQNPGFKVTRVGKPRVGEERPSEVIAEIRYTLPTQGYQIRQEWESIRSHDVLFLLFIDATIPDNASDIDKEKDEKKVPFPQQYGLKALRGAEVIEVIDESGKVINENDPSAERAGVRRTVRVRLDPAQFHADVLAARSGKDPENVDSRLDAEIPPLYRSMNAVMRRKAKENNFKAVLETIRELMNARSIIVPDWLRDVMLGYGDPSACTNIEKAQIIDFVDTFLNIDHLKQCFPGKTITVAPGTDTAGSSPFRVKFESETELSVESYTPQPRDFDPIHAVVPKKNSVPFTATQVEAIQQAMNKGLTLVVGPPGTGKTDVAVQTISNWYHNFPNERILLVTHSNNALNQIFEKIMALDIDERHMVRMGHGERTLETEKDFSRLGRVNHMLQLRLDLLQEVERLAQALQYPPDVAYSCETSANFFHYVVLAEWEKFLGSVKKFAANVPVRDLFPFAKFLTQDELDHAFNGLDAAPFEQQLAAAKTLFQRRIRQRIFDQLEECRPFELLKLQSDRGNYIVTKQARIVAMTCTHAALTRSQLLKLGFKFDNLLMEEAAQILEIETFIPMLLQEQSPEAGSRLKRIVLIGDHNQLPPIVQNMVFQKFGHLDQSLFARLVKLGVPHVTLDSQGRARPGLAELYSWRYQNLKNLPHVSEKREFLLANPGFRYDFQLIDVPDYLGRGEIEPSPYFFQNLGEAEYICAVYMYMRILGYPSEKISIITSYNGQKHLIRDVIRQRCGWNPAIGMPSKITTVDRYQGQQNDYILLSLVRTKTVGHIRDVRRLVVAMSRARLGLYVFCRKDLFKDCYELTPAFSKLLQRPDKLVLVQNEQYGDPNFARDAKADVTAESLLEVADVTHMAAIAAPANALGYDHAAVQQGQADNGDSPADAQNDEMQAEPTGDAADGGAEEAEPAADVRAEDDSDSSDEQ